MDTCILCDSNEITEMSHFFKHKVESSNCSAHYLCEKCIKEYITVCTCDKKLNENPKTLMIYCPCYNNESSQQNDQEVTKLLFDFTSAQPYLDNLLQHWSENYFILNGCKGCCYTYKDITTKVEIGIHSAMDACVFSIEKNENDGLSARYLNDAINEDFIDALKYSDKKLYDELGFDNIKDI